MFALSGVTDVACMDLYEFNTHSFIVKIWLEETAEEAGQATWRGYITHVPSGKRHYLENLDEISHFILPYLREFGVVLGMRWWFKRCLTCWKSLLLKSEGPNHMGR